MGEDVEILSSNDSGKPLDCGIIMPISAIDGCSADHWLDVKSIIVDAIERIKDYNFRAALVSDGDEVGVIQKRIIHGVYYSDIVVCDVSGKNPNVMFELGMRLAFNKPTVLIKDDKTDYSFDTSVIEHITYPRDLRYKKILEFKEILGRKITSTYEASISDPDHSTFLKNFGKFKVAKIDEQEASASNIVLQAIADLQKDFDGFRRSISGRVGVPRLVDKVPVYLSLAEVQEIIDRAESLIANPSEDASRDLQDIIPLLDKLKGSNVLSEALSRRVVSILLTYSMRSSTLPHSESRVNNIPPGRAN